MLNAFGCIVICRPIFCQDDCQGKGWEAGVDGNVALIKVGAGESAITAMSKQPIAAFVFDVKGLMADMSLRGAKFNKLDKGE